MQLSTRDRDRSVRDALTVSATMTLWSGHCPTPAAAVLLLQIAFAAAGLQLHRRQGRRVSLVCADGQRDAAAFEVRSVTTVLRADFGCHVDMLSHSLNGNTIGVIGGIQVRLCCMCPAQLCNRNCV